jgi:hypothetical protein
MKSHIATFIMGEWREAEAIRKPEAGGLRSNSGQRIFPKETAENDSPEISLSTPPRIAQHFLLILYTLFTSVEWGIVEIIVKWPEMLQTVLG